MTCFSWFENLFVEFIYKPTREIFLLVFLFLTLLFWLLHKIIDQQKDSELPDFSDEVKITINKDRSAVIEHTEAGKENAKLILTRTSFNLLKQGIKKGIKWKKLNQIHKKQFEKEIGRYAFCDAKMPDNSANFTLIVSFIGFDTGNANLSLEYEIHGGKRILLLKTGIQIDNFYKKLKGQSLTKGIDDLFR